MPSPFEQLGFAEQQQLIAHFDDEFDMDQDEATDALIACDADELAIHLDAAQNGYM